MELINIKKAFLFVSILFFIVILSINNQNSYDVNSNFFTQENYIESQLDDNIEENSMDEVFEVSAIPESVLNKMRGKSIPLENQNDVDVNNLSYLKITYWGFDDKTHIGEMIVNKEVAQEILDIFKEVYKEKYPIEKIKLIDEYNANDEESMENNNTSAFCYRKIANTNKLSEHSLGVAIDVNPLYNPYIVGEYVSPVNAGRFVDRDIDEKGVIKKGDVLYNAFIKRGWTWGGEWSGKKDYQHFEKSIK